MKTNKARIDLILTLGPLLVIACVLLVLFFPHGLANAFYVHWALLAFLFIIALGPWGKIRLATHLQRKPIYSLRSWLIRLLTFQICLFAVFFAISQLSGKIVPVLSQPHAYLFTHTMVHLLINFGLFPWAMVGIVMICIGLVSFYEKKDAFTHHLLFPLIKSSERGIFGLNVNTDTKLATFFAFSTSFALISLLIATIISSHFQPIKGGLHLGTLLIILFLILFAFTKPFKKILSRVLSRKYPLTLSLTGILIVLSLIIVFLNFLFHYFNQTTIKIPGIITIFEQHGFPILWLIFTISFWVAWIPITSLFIVRISEGYKIIHIVLAMLFLPLLFGLFIWLNQMYLFFNWSNDLFTGLIGLMGFIGLLHFITQKKLLPAIIWSYLPKEGIVKSRDHHFFFRKCLQITVAIIYIYLPVGMIGLSVLGLIFTLAFAVITILIAIALPLHFRKIKS